MYWLCGYCVFSWLVGVWFALRGLRSGDHQGQVDLLALYPVRCAAVLTLLVILTPVLLPLLLVWGGCLLVRCLWVGRRIQQAGRKYRELQFESVNFFQLESGYRSAIERGTGEFLGLGFDLLDDFQNKSDPVPVYNRYFVGHGGTVFGDLTALLEECEPGFFSVLEDGTYVETSGTEPCEIPGELVDDDRLCFTMAGEVPLGELLQLHVQTVQREAERRATHVLAFRPEQFREVAVFGQRRFWGWRRRCGENTGEVPDPILPQGEPVAPCQLRASLDACCASAAP